MDLAHTGGIEVVELNQLRGLNQREHQARLYVANLVGEHPDISRIPDMNWRSRIWQLAYYRRFGAREASADVFHGHYTPLLPLVYPQKSVVHYHGLTLSALPLYRYTSCARRYHQAHYIFCARWVGERFADMYPQMPRDHLHVIYNGADIDAFRPANPPRTENPVRIIFYAGWIPEKGIYELLDAVELIESKRTDFEVWYGGSAFSHYERPQSREIDEKVRSHAARLKTVKLIGHIAHADLPTLLQQTDIGCVPSIYEDPFPLVPLEMMAAGLPVVAFDLGGPKEAIVDGQTGFLVPNKDVSALAAALERLIDNEQLRREMAVKARRHVEQNFTWDRHIERLLEIYEQITQGNGGRSSAS